MMPESNGLDMEEKMDLQVKIFNKKRGELLDEGVEIEKAIEKLGWHWYGSGYDYEDNYRELVFRRQK